MIITLSPAKLFNTEVKLISNEHNSPYFSAEAQELNRSLKQYTVEELAHMMKINPQLALETYGFIHSFEDSQQLYSAACLYNGITYQGLDFASFSKEDMAFAQQHLCILSGLYGLLKPLDAIKPYRLEMQTLLANKIGDDLYHFWKEKLTRKLNDLLDIQIEKVWVNLTSKEYEKVIDKKKLSSNTQIIKPVFKEYKVEGYKQIVVYVKRARGLMARFIIENKLEHAEDIKSFDLDGYSFAESLSSAQEWVFIR